MQISEKKKYIINSQMFLIVPPYTQSYSSVHAESIQDAILLQLNQKTYNRFIG